MVQYQQQEELDRAFAALSDSTRRSILDHLGAGSVTISQLAEPAGMSLTGMKKHVGILEDAGLVRTEKVGRTRRCSLGPQKLDPVLAWIEEYRTALEDRLDRLAELVENTNNDEEERR